VIVSIYLEAMLPLEKLIAPTRMLAVEAIAARLLM
jgi:hypothetical protein